MSIQGKVAVITGAGGNLGSTVTKRFLQEGAQVALTYRDEGQLADFLTQLPPGANPLAIPCDVSADTDVQQMMEEVHNRLGGPHVLLNLVGGWAGGKTVAETEEADWDRMMTLNLKTAFLCAKHALAYMIPQDYGRIVSVSSKAALDLPAKSAAYAVSKAGVLSLAKCLAQEVKGTGVAAMAILPSVIDTPPNRAAMPKADFTKWVAPEQIAEVLVYLAGEAGAALNGALLPVFGGV
jgi:NAD(P)-dependent dehydrogenase (short-subunit alcohol dehydrogenase family)